MSETKAPWVKPWGVGGLFYDDRRGDTSLRVHSAFGLGALCGRTGFALTKKKIEVTCGHCKAIFVRADKERDALEKRNVGRK